MFVYVCIYKGQTTLGMKPPFRTASWKSSRQHENVNVAYIIYETPRGVERHVLSFRHFPATRLDCGTRHLYASCFVVQLLGDLYENETYKGVCGQSSLSNVVLYENVNEILY